MLRFTASYSAVEMYCSFQHLSKLKPGLLALLSVYVYWHTVIIVTVEDTGFNCVLLAVIILPM